MSDKSHKSQYLIQATYSAQGCRQLLTMGGEKRIQTLKDTYGYLNLTIQDYFWLDAGKRVFLLVECDNQHAEETLGALKIQTYAQGLLESLSMDKIYSSDDIESIKHIAKVIK